MSPSFNIALSIWCRTLLANFILIACKAFYEMGFAAVFSLILIAAWVLITTVPLLIVINRLVKWMAIISYSPNSRLASLGFSLILVGLGFYALVATLLWVVFDIEIFIIKDFHLLIFSTVIAIVFATWSVKTSFIKLNSENHEKQLG